MHPVGQEEVTSNSRGRPDICHKDVCHKDVCGQNGNNKPVVAEDDMQKTLTFILFSCLSIFMGSVLREPAPSPPVRRLDRPDTATVCVLGDLMMHSAQIAEGGWRESLRLIRPLLEEATVSIANMEFTLAGRPYSGYPCFSAPEDYALTAADFGIDVFLTANNHITDKGAAGLKRTLRFYDRLHDSLGIFHTGCDSLSAPLFVRANNIRLGIVNATCRSRFFR